MRSGVCIHTVVLGNLLRSNLTKVGGYLEQLSELICWRDLAFARFQILKEITIASIFSVQHHQRYLSQFFLVVWFPMSFKVLASDCFGRHDIIWAHLRSFILQEREKYKLGSPESFHYLNQSKCYKLDGVSDAEEYLATRRAMDIVGISEEEQVTISPKGTTYCAYQLGSQHYIFFLYKFVR